MLRNFSLSILLLLLPCFLQARPTTDDHGEQLPTCTQTTVIAGRVLQEDLDGKRLAVSTSLSLSLGLGEAACLRVQDAKLALPDAGNQSSEDAWNETYSDQTILYVVQYLGVQQVHPVRQQYLFGIPLLRSRCVCDCAGGDDHCPVGGQYKNCSKSGTDNADGVCVSTRFAHQSGEGCPTSGESSLCCEVTARPADDRRMLAVQLGQPDVLAEFRYQLFTSLDNRLIRQTDETFRVALNQRQRLDFPKDHLQVLVKGTKPFYQLQEDTYFFQTSDWRRRRRKRLVDASSLEKITLKHGAPINQFHEHSMSKLGWFRRQNRRWTIRNSWIRLADAHRARVTNCKGQTYTESYAAEYYVTGGEVTTAITNDDPLPLGHDVKDDEHWISDVSIEPAQTDKADEEQVRRVIVAHKDSNAVDIDLSMDADIRLVSVAYHGSSLTDFSGQIRTDRYSNRYLNLTFVGAKGTVIGTVFRTQSGLEADMAFSHYVEDPARPNALLTLPVQVDSSRWVCIHPANKPGQEICRWLSYDSTPIDTAESAYSWTAQKGQCDGCNEASLQSFVQYLNPLQWLNGISTPAQALAVAVELLFYGALALIVIALCRRVACPIIRWAACGGDSCHLTSDRHTKQPQVPAV